MKRRRFWVLALGMAAILAIEGAAQESAQLFGAPAVVATDVDAFRAALDLNGDGDKDALSIWFTSPTAARLAAWKNDGSGAFSPGWSFAVSLSFLPPINIFFPDESHVAVGDFNGDTREDFVWTVEKLVGWWYSNGDTVGPTLSAVIQMPSQVLDVAVADFDLDGLADVAVLTAQELRIYRSQAGAPPLLASTLTFSPANAQRVLAAELSGDATPDVAVLRPGALEIRPVLFCVIQPGQTLAGPSGSSHAIVAGDVDNDGDIDLVLDQTFGGSQAVGQQTTVSTLLRTGPSTFVSGPVATGGFASPSRALADADQDGDVDLIGISGEPKLTFFAVATNDVSAIATVRKNDGTGFFGQPLSWHFGGAVGELAVVDVDGDGDLDMIAGRCVQYGLPGVGFAPTMLPKEPGGLVAVGDFDRDGDPDLGPGIGGIGLQGSVIPGTAVNDGSGTFVTGSTVAPPAAPGTSFMGPGIPGDFDGDGNLDIVAEHVYGTSVYGGFEMRFLRNLGGGGLVDGGPATNINLTMRNVPTDGGTGYALLTVIDHHIALVADVDADGDQDIVTFYPGFYDGVVSEQGSQIWLNTGAGFFYAALPLPGIRIAAAGDLSGDGLPELVGMQRNGGTPSLVVLQGLAGGGFSAPTALLSGLPNIERLDQPVIVDCDGDGDLDVVSGSPSGLTVFQNNLAGPLIPIVLGSPEALASPIVVKAADMNGDGLVDLLASCTPAPAVRLFLRDPANAGWLLPKTWSADLGSLADVDGDGDLDLLSGNLQPGARAYLSFNRTWSPPSNGFRRQYGTGLAGSGGFIPVLGASGPLRTGFSGQVRLTDCFGGAGAFLGVGYASASQPAAGGTLLIVPSLIISVSLAGSGGIPGAGSLSFPWTLPPGLSGVTFYLQAAVSDPGALQGFAFSQGLRCTIGM